MTSLVILQHCVITVIKGNCFNFCDLTYKGEKELTGGLICITFATPSSHNRSTVRRLKKALR